MVRCYVRRYRIKITRKFTFTILSRQGGNKMMYRGDFLETIEHGAGNFGIELTEEQGSQLAGEGDDVIDIQDVINNLGHGALAKSFVDQFTFMLRLRTGERILYSTASFVSKEWMHLHEARFYYGEDYYNMERGTEGLGVFPRGIDVRISDIVWVQDAPFGS